MLVSMKAVLDLADAKKIAVGAFNITSLEGIQAVLGAAEELGQPVILQFAPVHESIIPLKVIGPVMVMMAEKSSVPVCVHLDHGDKLEILNDEFQHVHKYNPIEHIKTRIKTPESIVKKLKRYGYETSIENMLRYINDIAGVRLICSFTSDIYRLAEMIGNQSDLKVLAIKDYIKKPKESGYKSYHMLVSVPIFLSDSVVDTKVEIQIRTIAMDFWASLEHKIYYKFEGDAPDYISRELQECAQMVSELDDKMLSLNEAIQACLEVENTPVPVELVKENQEQEKKQEDIVEHILGKES